VLVPVTVLLLLVPDGRPPGRRWRPLLPVAAAVVAAFTVVLAVAPYQRLGHANPVGLPAVAGLGAVFPVVLAALAAVTAACAAALLRRLWTAHGTRRLQLAWVAAGGATFAATTFGNALLPRPADAVVEVAGALAFPLAVGVAMLRHRLYDTDPVLRRALLYGTVALALAGTYVAAVAAAGALLRDRGPWPAALAATVTALAVSPLRRAVARFVDRTLYGRRGDPYAVLVELDRRLITATGPEQVLAAVAEAVAGALRLPYVRAEVAGGLLAVPAGAPAPLTRDLPVVFQGTTVGRLRLAARRDGEGFDARDERALAGIAGHAAAPVASAHRELQLREARSRLVEAREEERRRLRRDLHDGLGPVLAGLGFTADAAVNTARTDPERLERHLRTVREQAGAAATVVRRLSRELRPPDLDQLGLAAALEAAAERLPGLPVEVRVRGDAGALDAATEVAAYLIAVEALTNAAKYAGARRCIVDVDVAADALTLDVRDDGVGADPGAAPGVGSASMRERAEELGGRLTVEPAHPGTRVHARIPLRREPR
jgi:signal transduction histidine kinase